MADKNQSNQGNQDDELIIDISGEELSEADLLGLGKKKTQAATKTSTKQQGAKSKQNRQAIIAAAMKKFHIPLAVKEQYSRLIPLIIETESMDDEEREYWFQILPIMTREQVIQFRKILITEKQQLAKLDKEYEKELAKINAKHVAEWEQFEIKEKTEEIRKEEAVSEVEEEALEADLLKKLKGL